MKSYQESAKELKKLGLIGYDLRKKLTPGQKSNISRLENKYKGLINRPFKYDSTLVSDKRAKNVEGAVFAIKPKKGAKGKTRLYFEGEITHVGKKTIEVKKGDFTYTYLEKDKTPTLDINAKIRKMEKRLKENEFMTVNLNGHQFNTKYLGAAQLEAYLADWVPKDVDKDHKEYKNYLLGEMTIVKATLPYDHPLFEGTEYAEKGKAKTGRRRNRR